MTRSIATSNETRRNPALPHASGRRNWFGAALLYITPIAVAVCVFGLRPSSFALAAQSQEKSAGQSADLHSLLAAILERQQTAWNRGSIEDFMSAYWRSEELTFSSGGKTQRGWNSTRDRYLKRYPTKAKMGQLAFSELESSSLGTDHALMLGRWKLNFESSAGVEAESAQGNFSLIWKKIDGDWKIIHDHSSSIASDDLAQ